MGREESLRGHIYDYSTGRRNTDQYIRTTKEIEAYVGRKFTWYTKELIQGIKEVKLNPPTKPATLTGNDAKDKFKFEEWKADNKEYREKAKIFEDFKAQLFLVIFGQCTDAMQDHIRSHRDFDSADGDGIQLLKLLKQNMHSVEEDQHVGESVLEIKEAFFSF